MVQQSFAVHHQTQTISFPAIPSQIIGTNLTLSATASSGLPVSFATTTSTVCSVAGTTATMLAKGNCIIQASQAGNGAYAAAPGVSQYFAVSLPPQTITFPAITGNEVAATKISLTATASSGLTVAFASTTPTVCTVSGTTASLLIAGSCGIQATQAGNSSYAPAPAVTQSFVVHHNTQTITFPAIPSQVVGAIVTLSATASSGLPVSFATTTSTVCSVAGTTATMLATGNCVIQASQAGNGAYAVAPGASQYFVVKKAQTITFPAITATEVATTTLGLSATSSSGLTVAFASTTPTICTVAGTTASLLIAGTCTIQATQAGNSVYGPAPMVSQSFAVHHETQTITFPQIASQVVGAQVTLTATASSGLAVSFATTTPTVCSVSGTMSPMLATMLATGNCVIQASQAGNAAYAVAPGVSQYFAVKAN
jgi:hypothetical protein